MVVLEAMAAGVPIVSCAKGGPREIIKDGENGIIIENQNPVEMANKVNFLIQNPNLKLKMGNKGKCHVAKSFRIQEQVKKTESLYDQLLAKKKL